MSQIVLFHTTKLDQKDNCVCVCERDTEYIIAISQLQFIG